MCGAHAPTWSRAGGVEEGGVRDCSKSRIESRKIQFDLGRSAVEIFFHSPRGEEIVELCAALTRRLGRAREGGRRGACATVLSFYHISLYIKNL